MHAKPLLSLLGLAAALASCGGGGGGGSGYTITGVAASGAAIVRGTVQAQCRVGSGSTVTETDGSFRLSLPGAQGPCLLRTIDPVTGLEMHSALEEGAVQAIAHITPLTDLVVARAIETAPAIAFADANQYWQRLNPASLSTGVQAAREAAAAVGTPLPEGLDLLKGPLQTATAEAQGSVMDRAFDALMATLAAADQALSELARRLAAIGDSDEGAGQVRGVIDGLVTSSAQALPGCPASRGGLVWLIDVLSGQSPQAHEIVLGAGPRLVRLSDSSSVNITVDAAQSCVFSAGDKTFRISDNGMGIWTNPAAWGVIVPMQPSVRLTAPSFSGQYGALALMQANYQGTDFTPAAAFNFRINAPGRPLIEGKQCQIGTGGGNQMPSCSSPDDALALGFAETNCQKIVVPYGGRTIDSGALQCSSGSVQAHVVGYKAGGGSSLLITLNSFPVTVGSSSLPGRGLVVLNKVTGAMALPQVSSIAAGAFWEGGYDPTLESRFYSAPVAQSSLSGASGTSYQQTRGAVTYTHHLDTPTAGLVWSRSGSSGTMIRLASPAGWSFAAERVDIPEGAALGDVYRLSGQVRRQTSTP
jgi:hypothetical protein